MNALFLLYNIITTSKFLHITDIHYDPLYSTNSPTKCVLGSTGLGCCHKYDLPLKNNIPASKWGDYNCDSPFKLVDETLNWISNNFNNSIDFIIYTGDSASHHDFSNSPSIIKKSIADINSLFRLYFRKIPIYNNLGNHDTWPIDQTVPLEYNKLLEFISTLWYQDINKIDDMTDINLKKGGYYALDLHNTTKLISFNSIYYDGHNIFKHEKNLENDPQIIWLENTLKNARISRQNVWFISHIFPTAGESTNEYNSIIKQIIWTYRDIIKYQWWGHSHNDQFILYQNTDYNNKTSSFSLGMVGPSIMPDKRFPAFRIYDYNPDTFQLIDYTQYYCNLSKVILTDNLEYTKQYSFKELYNLDGLEVSDFEKLYKGIQNGTYTQKYCKQYTPGYNTCTTNNIII